LVGKIQEAKRTTFALGTIAHFSAFGRDAEKAIDHAVKRLNEIDDKFSVFKPGSEISEINAEAGKDPINISEDTFFLLDKAVEYSRLLEGTFDPTIRPLVDLWGIGSKKERIPTEREIAEKLRLVNYRDLELGTVEKTARLKNKGQSIDMGGIAKGYAADVIRDIFKGFNIESALIDLGGNIIVLGGKPDGTPWNVGIQDPFRTRGEHIGILKLVNKSIVTSGSYEKFFFKDEKMFHHIIDPGTGYPAKSRIVSATIISDDSLDGDGLSTGVYIMGVEKSMQLIESFTGIDAIFVTEDRRVYASSGIRNNFILTNDDFLRE